MDPRFGLRLRELRTERGLSLRTAAAVLSLSKSQISEYENGKRRPSVGMAEHLDRALNAGGALARLVVEDGGGEEAERVAHAVLTPRLVDAATVDHLAERLARSRHLDDMLDATMLLPTVETDLEMAQQVAREARGPHAERLHLVVAEWTQFAGWMNAQVRRDPRAARLLETAARDALALGDADLSSQAHNFRGALERWKDNPRGIVRHFMAAHDTPGASDLHRVDAAVQAAQGLGMLGDHREATRLLQAAEELTTAADGRADSAPTAYWLTPAWLRLPLGLAHLGLGNHAAAAESLRAGLENLPDGWQGADWSAEYRQALDQAEGAA
ncbi:helix-turn-helix domain-containing protein [Promicromonospora sukumoe]|uniref:helix-turn-helix domain-containing protein n=1 Tax=Promicromonospora sukumoe TaxID=88382 RepID=UPI0037C95B70